MNKLTESWISNQLTPLSITLNLPGSPDTFPDFVLDNGVIVETKGRLTQPDRAKMLNIVRDNPSLDIRFVFQRAGNRITRSKNSLTYWQWAEKHGFPWAQGTIPEEWWNEKT